MFGLKLKRKDIIHMLIIGIIAMIVIFIAGMRARMIIVDDYHPDNQETLKPVEGDFTIGDLSALVQVVFYGDFACYHCMRFIKENFDRLRDEYILTGKALFIFRPVITSKRTMFGAKFLFCDKRDDDVNADIFQNMFNNRWMLKGDFLNALLSLVEKNNWSTSEHFRQCVSSKDIEKNLRMLYENTVLKLNIHKTPYLFINQRPVDTDRTMFYMIDKEYKYLNKLRRKK